MTRSHIHPLARPRPPRGQSLLMAMIVVAVLAVLGAAALTYTGQGLSSARQHQKREVLSACSTAARSWVVAQFRPGAKNSEQILEFKGSLDAGRFVLHTGHIDTTANPPPAVTKIGSGSGSWGTIDLTNTTALGRGRLGGQTYQAVVTCIEKETGMATEVEFALRLSL